MSKGRIKIGAKVLQDRGISAWPVCSPPQKEYPDGAYRYVAKNPNMVFDIRKEGDFWICRADGYGMLRSKGEVGDYGNGAITVFKEEDILFCSSEEEDRAEMEKDAARYRWLKKQKSLELITGSSVVWIREDGSSFSSPYTLSAGGTRYAVCETLDKMIDIARKVKL